MSRKIMECGKNLTKFVLNSLKFLIKFPNDYVSQL